MFLHAGNGKNIREQSIIGIFDADTATVSRYTKQFLHTVDQKKGVSFASPEIPKAFLLYRENGKDAICFSQLSSAALRGRCEDPYRFAEDFLKTKE